MTAAALICLSVIKITYALFDFYHILQYEHFGHVTIIVCIKTDDSPNVSEKCMSKECGR